MVRNVRLAIGLTTLATLATPACTRLNPAFSDDGSGTAGDGGSATSKISTTDAAGTTADPPPTSTTSPSTSAKTSVDDDDSESTLGPPPDDVGQMDQCDGWEAGCDLFEADACPNGQKCAPVEVGQSWGTWCVPIDDDVQDPGGPCDSRCGRGGGLDDCPPGSICWDGLCESFCDPVDPECDGTRLCHLSDSHAPFGLCRDQCDPLEGPRACPPGEACVPDDQTRFECRPAGSGNQGVPCFTGASCVLGLVCVPSQNFFNCQEATCCAALCNLDDDDCAPDVCTGFMPPNPLFPNVGYCRYAD